MKKLALLVALLFSPVAVRAASLTPILLLNGTASYPCNGVDNEVAQVPVNANVVSTFIFVVTSSPAIDAAVVPSGNSTYGTIADVHQVVLHGFSPGGYAAPAWISGYADMWSGQEYRNFEPDSVAVGNADVYVYCAGGGWANVFLVTYTRATP